MDVKAEREEINDAYLRWAHSQPLVVLTLYSLWLDVFYTVTRFAPLHWRARSAGFPARAFCNRRLADRNLERTVECAGQFLAECRSFENWEVEDPLGTLPSTLRVNISCLTHCMEQLCPDHEATRELGDFEKRIVHGAREQIVRSCVEICVGIVFPALVIGLLYNSYAL